ncbi:MAG: ParB/RepB/Spo0J family partition protein [Candidatus Pacebacteria bacterium]|nr:ParB/RepB/Spo0J family partition protein [Candidatus Paceibacterota bacterium]
MSEYQNNSIFWVETMKIKPNPFQPRKEFEPKALEDLADSIRQYGVLQPLVVTRKETLRPDNHGMDVHYELIAGERRLRASKIAGLAQVPVIIRKETDDKVKLELAIIENLQREDLNPIDRALAFEQLYKEFNLTHVEIGKRMGKSRVYVSNTLRLLSLPEEIKQGLMAGRITEGHTRPLLMLSDRPEEQTTLYKEIMVKKMSVRDAEKVARNIAQDKVRKKEFKIDPRIRDFEKKLSENLGTRVHIEPKENGGQITIDYFTIKDLEEILSSMKKVEHEQNMMERYLENKKPLQVAESQPTISTKKEQEELSQSTGVNFHSLESKTEENIQKEVQEYHQSLPEYHKIPNTDIQEYHEEIEAPLEKINQHSELESEQEDAFSIPETLNDRKPQSLETQRFSVNHEVNEQAIYSANNTQQQKVENSYESNMAYGQDQNYTPQDQESVRYNQTQTIGMAQPEPQNTDYTQQNSSGGQYTYQNQQYYQAQPAPKKKGFFGKIFG